jgi:hypothetical protein
MMMSVPLPLGNISENWNFRRGVGGGGNGEGGHQRRRWWWVVVVVVVVGEEMEEAREQQQGGMMHRLRACICVLEGRIVVVRSLSSSSSSSLSSLSATTQSTASRGHDDAHDCNLPRISSSTIALTMTTTIIRLSIIATCIIRCCMAICCMHFGPIYQGRLRRMSMLIVQSGW